MSKNTGEKTQWDALTEEELKFSWQCLVDQGQLTASKLQKFMLEVTGDELTPIQTKDLLGYLDATGDGRVGMEEFFHFMSASELDMTDPQTFLWSPTKRFRERLGLVRVEQNEETAPPDAGDKAAQPHPWDGLFLEADDLPTEFSRSMDSNRSERRNSLGKKGGKAVHPPAVPAVEEESIAIEEEEVISEGRASRPPASKPHLDEKTLARIFMSVEKYEQQTWERLHHEQEAVRRKLFAQWTQNPNEMTSKEYHKMLSKMHKLARSSMPGDLKPGDTLATMEYLLEATSAPKSEPGAEVHAPRKQKLDKRRSSKAENRPEDELQLPFANWNRFMSGKLRREAEAKKEGKEGKEDAKEGKEDAKEGKAKVKE